MTQNAYVVAADELEPLQTDGDTAATRISVDASAGSSVLEQRVIRFSPGRSQPQELDGRQGILYVVEGSGSLKVEGRAYELEPEMGAYVARESFVVDNPGPDNVLLV